MIGIALGWVKSHWKLLVAFLAVALLAAVGVLGANLRAARIALIAARRDYETEKAARRVALDELRSEREARQRVRKAEDDLIAAVEKNAADASAQRKELDAAQAELDARVAARKARKSAAAEHNRRKAAR